MVIELTLDNKENEVSMSTLAFILVLALSVSVYAKTEAGLSVEGYSKTQRQSRNLAAATVSDMGAIMDQLNKMNGKPKAKSYDKENVGFSGESGALKRIPKKKSAVTSGSPADSTK